MSKTEHIKGKLRPTGKTLKQFAPDVIDFDELDEAAFLIDGLIYEVEKTEIDPYEDIFSSSENKDGSINFEVKFYNGGCGFSEAIDYALQNKIKGKE